MGYRYRLYPSPETSQLLARYAGAERAIYNRAVQHQRELRALALRRRRLGGRMVWPRGEMLTYSDVSAWAAVEAPWLVEIPGQVRSQAVRIARRALVDSWRIEDRAAPTFRSCYGGTNGFSWQAATLAGEMRKISARWHEVRLPACRGAEVVWCRVRVDVDRQPPLEAYRGGKLVRITCDTTGTWWLSLTGSSPAKPAAPAATSCGIDVGVAHTLTLADHTGRVLHLDLPRLLSEPEARRLRSLQQALARTRWTIPCRGRCAHAAAACWKTSARYEQRRRQVAELRQRARRRWRDWAERVTTSIADRYKLVAVEALQIQSMTASASGTAAEPGRNVAAKSGLNRSILDQGWGMIVRRLEEKLAARGGQLVRVPAANTSRRCYECGHTQAGNRKTQAEFRCAACGHSDGADANAARNIHYLALQGHPPACGGAAAERASAPVAATDVEDRRQAADEASITLAA